MCRVYSLLVNSGYITRVWLANYLGDFIEPQVKLYFFAHVNKNLYLTYSRIRRNISEFRSTTRVQRYGSLLAYIEFKKGSQRKMQETENNIYLLHKNKS